MIQRWQQLLRRGGETGIFIHSNLLTTILGLCELATSQGYQLNGWPFRYDFNWKILLSFIEISFSFEKLIFGVFAFNLLIWLN